MHGSEHLSDIYSEEQNPSHWTFFSSTLFISSVLKTSKRNKEYHLEIKEKYLKALVTMEKQPRV